MFGFRRKRAGHRGGGLLLSGAELLPNRGD